MKTVKDSLDLLPEPFRTQAIKNTDSKILKSVYAGSIKEDLPGAFVFHNSPEGYHYWSNLFLTL
jgi:hypothetical protein